MNVFRFLQLQQPLIAVLFRWLLPVLSATLIFLCGKALLGERKTTEIWAWLILPGGKRLPLMHWENTLGSGKSCDITLPYPSVSRLHAVLTRREDGSWRVRGIHKDDEILVGGARTAKASLRYGEPFRVGGAELTLAPVDEKQAAAQASYRPRAESGMPLLPIVILTALQLCLAANLILVMLAYRVVFALCMFCLITLEWFLWTIYKLRYRRTFALETLAFFLCSYSLAVLASAAPDELIKQTAAIFGGVAAFLLVGWFLRKQNRVHFLRYAAAAVGVILLILPLVFGEEIGGARNWVRLSGVSVQPSELTKLCFAFVCTASLDRLTTKRNLWFFLLYTAVLCALLALCNDFGTALVFFIAFLVVAFLRSGNFAALTLICAGTGFAGFMVAHFLPYVRSRFTAWRHVWEYPLTSGYQQTQAMMCMAAGGLLGIGACRSWLRYVAASESDLVFALVGEEYGLISALMMLLPIVLIAVFVFKTAPSSRTGFSVIGGCAALSILLTQIILNVFGTVDLLPLTGVTFPFLSDGGSSMIASWGLLAFVNSVDPRRTAVPAVPLPAEEGKV